MTMPGDVTFNSGDSYFGGNLTTYVRNGTIPEERVDDMGELFTSDLFWLFLFCFVFFSSTPVVRVLPSLRGYRGFVSASVLFRFYHFIFRRGTIYVLINLLYSYSYHCGMVSPAPRLTFLPNSQLQCIQYWRRSY
jgi:hypothetical protein